MNLAAFFHAQEQRIRFAPPVQREPEPKPPKVTQMSAHVSKVILEQLAGNPTRLRDREAYNAAQRATHAAHRDKRNAATRARRKKAREAKHLQRARANLLKFRQKWEAA